ncbi:MAG TPA: LptA/OstA family protein [Phenylobacterium sp.]|jgi:lipopolysaccharide export system protein LptA
MKSPIAMAFLAAAALGVQPAAAQLAKNPKAPVDVVADNFEMHNAECVGVYTGSAEASQDTSRLRADKMTIHLEVKKNKPGAAGAVGASSCGDMLSLEANGSVYYVSSDGRRIHGDHGFYDAPSAIITITGDVTAVDGQNVMRGAKMVYNTQTGEGHVEGGGKGPGAKNRPRGVFYPKDANDQGGSTPKKAGKS